MEAVNEWRSTKIHCRHWKLLMRFNQIQSARPVARRPRLSLCVLSTHEYPCRRLCSLCAFRSGNRKHTHTALASLLSAGQTRILQQMRQRVVLGTVSRYPHFDFRRQFECANRSENRGACLRGAKGRLLRNHRRAASNVKAMSRGEAGRDRAPDHHPAGRDGRRQGTRSRTATTRPQRRAPALRFVIGR
jgi:hypothetical protein